MKLNYKNIISLILFISIFISCNNKLKVKEVQVIFDPSFLDVSIFTINIETKTIKQFTFNRKDSSIVKYKKSFLIKNKVLDEFLLELETNKLDSTYKHSRSILDGIGFRISKIHTNNDTISLTSNYSTRNQESILEYQFLDAFFNLANKSVNDYSGIVQLEKIQDYFSYGLPIKKISSNPLEYRIWGSISGCREDNQEFLTFLQNLPDDKPILFDMRNGSFAYCLDEVLKEFSQKKELYIYGDEITVKLNEFYLKKIKFKKENQLIVSKEERIYNTSKLRYDKWKIRNNLRLYNTKEEILNELKVFK